MLSDAAYIGNRVSWKVSLLLGAFFFVTFFWLVPAWLGARVEATESAHLRPALEALIGRRLHWFKWLALAIALVFGYFAARSYMQASRHTRIAERNTGLVARLMARLLN
jgi:uncharacterized membrane protein